MKDGYKLELQTLINDYKLFRSTKKLIDKTKNGENVLEKVDVFLVQCNLVDNQHQQKSEVLYTFTPNKFYASLLNVEPSNLMFLKTYNAEFDEIIMTFRNKNGRPLEIEDKVSLTLLINKQKCHAIITLLYRTRNKKICQRIQTFFILEKVI